MLSNDWDKIKRYFPPTPQEWLEFLLVALAYGFVISFNNWGMARFDATEGLTNLLLATILCAIALGIHHAAQRLAGLRFDSMVRQHVWWTGMMITLLLAFITRGSVPFLASTGTRIDDLPLHRLGHFRYKIGTTAKMFIALAGPLANAFVAFVIWLLTRGAYIEGSVASTFISINILMAVLNLLPIPPLDGTRIFYVSRLFYAVVFSAVLAGSLAYIMIPAIKPLLLVIIAIVGAILGGLGWHHAFEK